MVMSTIGRKIPMVYFRLTCIRSSLSLIECEHLEKVYVTPLKNTDRFGSYLVLSPCFDSRANEQANITNVIRSTNLVLNLSANGLYTAFARSRLMAKSSQEVR